MKFRNRLLTLHSLVGILGGILLVIMGLTGSAIVFHQELDHALNPQLMQVTPQRASVSIDAVLQSAQSRLPNSRIESIRIPRMPEETYQLGLKATPDTLSEMFIDPYTGKVLGVRQSKQTIISILYAIHHDLFAGTLGLYLVGISGLILIAQAITGLVLWTGWRKLASGVRVRWKAPLRLLSFDLHNVGGFVSNLFLLITGFTGVIIVGAHILLAPPAAEAKVPPSFPSAIAVSQLLRTADAAIPEGTTMDVSFPDAQKMVVTKKLPQDHARFYFSTVTLDGRTGKVLELNKVTETPPMWKFLIPVADFHFGTFGGLPTRILYLFVGLMPAVLFVTGLTNWRRRRSLGAKRELAIAQAQPLQKTSVQ